MKKQNWSMNIPAEEFFKLTEKTFGMELLSAQVKDYLNDEPVWELEFQDVNDYNEFLRDTIYINAYGIVDMRKDGSLYQVSMSEKRFEELKPIISFIKKCNNGVKINEKTYIESFKELHNGMKAEYLSERIDELRRKEVDLINRKIRLKENMDTMLNSLD